VAERKGEQSPQEGFRDEFDTIDPTRWIISDYYTPYERYRPENVEIRDGILVCKVPAGVNEGGQIETVRRWHYGRYRCRMKANAVPNVITAFYSYYMEPVTGLEHQIDMQIYGDRPTLIDLVLWKDGVNDVVRLDLGFDASKDFHEYGYDWYPNGEKVVFWVDGRVLYEYTNRKYIPVVEQYCLLSCHAPSWAGTPPDPAESSFDWAEVALPLPAPVVFPWWLVVLIILAVLIILLLIIRSS